MDLGKEKKTGQLFKTSLEKSLFSSPNACIKSVEERLKKLRKKYSDQDMKDIAVFEDLKEALLKITPELFSRYVKLLELLKSKEYGCNPKANDDRVVAFTERIETMKCVADDLQKDLVLNDAQVQICWCLCGYV